MEILDHDIWTYGRNFCELSFTSKVNIAIYFKFEIICIILREKKKMHIRILTQLMEKAEFNNGKTHSVTTNTVRQETYMLVKALLECPERKLKSRVVRMHRRCI